ncbi:hypothetical protein QUF58_01970 [Anaerolineales bacterium HSG24]|nr:hypothetical protein [Anaerolineales bacterium HSG24]
MTCSAAKDISSKTSAFLTWIGFGPLISQLGLTGLSADRMVQLILQLIITSLTMLFALFVVWLYRRVTREV